MPPYTGSNKEKGDYNGIFVRVGSELIVTEPNDMSTKHNKLVENEGLRGKLIKALVEDIDSADAGYYKVVNSYPTIQVWGDSTSVDLPQSAEARTITKELFSEKSPGYTVR